MQEEARYSKHMKTSTQAAGFEDEERAHEPRNVHGLQKIETALICRPVKKLQTYSHKKLNSANNMNEKENRFSPEDTLN